MSNKVYGTRKDDLRTGAIKTKTVQQQSVGNAFSCSPEEHWEDTYEMTPSRLTANRVGAKYAKMVNREGIEMERLVLYITRLFNNLNST